MPSLPLVGLEPSRQASVPYYLFSEYLGLLKEAPHTYIYYRYS